MIDGTPAERALELLKEGNRIFTDTGTYGGDVSPERRIDRARHGQHPYAAIVTCSDSRVIPEIIFNTGIGDIFVMRSAGNIVDNCTLESVEYAVGHLHCNLVVVMGHTECGAIAEAMRANRHHHALDLIRDICSCIGCERDPTKASCMNVGNSVGRIERYIGGRYPAKVVGALYDVRTGVVDFNV